MADPWFIAFLFFVSVLLPIVVVYLAYKHDEPVGPPRSAEIGKPPVPATSVLTSSSPPRSDRPRRRRRAKNQEPAPGDLGLRPPVPPAASTSVAGADRPIRTIRGGAKSLGEASASSGVPSPPDLAGQRAIIREIVEVELEKEIAEGKVGVPSSRELRGRKKDNRVEIGRGNDDFVKDEVDAEKEGEMAVDLDEGDLERKRDARALSEETRESLLHCDDEWEGIELSDVQKVFRIATQFVDGKKGAEAVSKLSSELQMQLYGLRKVATEGPCYEPQPMAFKVSSRSKWHAWQRLGNMNPDVAMELYTSLLSENVPEWFAEKLWETKVDCVSGIDQHDPKASSDLNTDTWCPWQSG
ncbi:acyl-CoA-binding domain-containing protein 3-like [Zingiber officinale]|uniref:acyl-CoA-binding domain-containing protein 3-like n=1 Tax=Zingiber officinale TaxID=94328 RepID=UPI001C4C19CF|nr:acyl-CoA-binding domain-containing protein 3-like [Zingiber officinale]